MIQEINSSKESKKVSKVGNPFGDNLRKAFKSERSEDPEKGGSGDDIKIRVEETWLTPVSSKKLH